MNKPIKPGKDDCCNGGCNPCIFDVYDKQLKQYQKWLESGEKYISELGDKTFKVVQNEVVCKSHHLIRFKLIGDDDHDKDVDDDDGEDYKILLWKWNPGNHFLYRYESEGVSCTRPYTPITINGTAHFEYNFSIIVKKYDNGLVSTHLCNLKEGDKCIWRGPFGDYKIVANSFNRIIMIAQGTGIAPLISIADSVLDDEEDTTKIKLFYCCQCDDTILFREELYAYRSYWNFDYQIFLSSVSKTFVPKYKEPITINKLTYQDLENLKPFGNDQFLICGSPKFNKSYHKYLKTKVPEVKNVVLF